MLNYNGEEYWEYEDIITNNYTWYNDDEVEILYEKSIDDNWWDSLLLNKWDRVQYDVWLHDFIGENFTEVEWLYYYNEEIDEVLEITTGEALSFWLNNGLIWNKKHSK